MLQYIRSKFRLQGNHQSDSPPENTIHFTEMNKAAYCFTVVCKDKKFSRKLHIHYLQHVCQSKAAQFDPSIFKELIVTILTKFWKNALFASHDILAQLTATISMVVAIFDNLRYQISLRQGLLIVSTYLLFYPTPTMEQYHQAFLYVYPM